MIGWWDPVPDAERRRWELQPHVGVGPLRFDMGPDEVTAALDGVRFTISSPRQAVVANRYGTMLVHYYAPDVGVTLYYDPDKRLKAIALDALRGPQVVADGTALVGRVPSELQQWIIDRFEADPDGGELHYTCGYEHASASLGVVVGLQRSGDRLLTRPVFLPAEAWDDLTHYMPQEVWGIR